MRVCGITLRTRNTRMAFVSQIASIEDIVLPEADGGKVRLGDLWDERPMVFEWLRHYG